jgi:hypothetical protein
VYSAGGQGSFEITGAGGSTVIQTSSPWRDGGFGFAGYTVDAGSYPWTFHVPGGWIFESSSCEDRGGNADSSAGGPTVTAVVGPDETVVCSFYVRAA